MPTGMAASSVVLLCWYFGAARTFLMLAVLAFIALAFLLNGVPSENAGHRVGVVGYDRWLTLSLISSQPCLQPSQPICTPSSYPGPDQS